MSYHPFILTFKKPVFVFTVNVTLKKPAYQQYQWNPGDSRSEASNVVDGLKSDLSLFGGQCVASGNNRETATWWVNLTSIHSVHHITIYHRTDNMPWGVYRIDIRMSLF